MLKGNHRHSSMQMTQPNKCARVCWAQNMVLCIFVHQHELRATHTEIEDGKPMHFMHIWETLHKRFNMQISTKKNIRIRAIFADICIETWSKAKRDYIKSIRLLSWMQIRLRQRDQKPKSRNHIAILPSHITHDIPQQHNTKAYYVEQYIFMSKMCSLPTRTAQIRNTFFISVYFAWF